MTETKKRFHLFDVLTIATLKIISPRPNVGNFKGVFSIIDYMRNAHMKALSDNEAFHICRGILQEQFPWFKELDPNLITRGSVVEWRLKQIELYGEYLEVARIPKEFVPPEN